jgi:hypothetical protein
MVLFRASLAGTALMLVVGLSSACSPTSPSSLISREQAIDLARQAIDFEPKTVSVETSSFHGSPVWTISFSSVDSNSRTPGQFAKLNVDRKTGEVTWIAMS